MKDPFGGLLQKGGGGAPCAVLGPSDSATYVAQAGGVIVPSSERFRALVIGDESGYPFLETVDTTLSRLLQTIDAGEPVDLVLPNPDLIYPGEVIMLPEAGN